MGRKVFISVLGTGFYGSCKYVKENFVSSDTRFIQYATLELLNAKEWKKEDAIIILLTEGARKINWAEDLSSRKNVRTQKDEPYNGLHKLLKDMRLSCGIHDLAIPDGKNEREMWRIFETLFNELQDGDELYFELTHSFRYLPMLVLVLGNYAKFIKNVKVRYISYGNYEARNIATNEAPIVDLLSLSLLQDWTFAAANYLQNGNVSFLKNLCSDSLTPILRNKESRKENPSAEILKKYVTALQTVTEDMKGCRGIEIISGKHIKAAQDYSQQLSQVIISPMQPIVEKMKDSFNRFTPSEDIINGYRAANWCYEHQLYQQSWTILYENIVSHVCQAKSLNYKNEDERKLVSSAFKIMISDKPEEEWKVDKPEDKQLIRDLKEMELMKNLKKIFSGLTVFRNDYNHAGMKGNRTTTKNLTKRIKDYIDAIYKMFLQDESTAG